jgi:hypothetical protein
VSADGGVSEVPSRLETKGGHSQECRRRSEERKKTSGLF